MAAPHIVPVLPAALLIGLAFVTSVALPLATYTTALALFGLAHVVFELRYVAWRFSGILRRSFLRAVAALIAATVSARAATMLHLIGPGTGISIELICGALLALLPAAVMQTRRMAGFFVALPFAVGGVMAPFETLLALAILHNLTPVAFLADLFEGSARRAAVVGGLLLFAGLPLLIASGLPWDALAALGLTSPDLTLFRAGSLEDNLGAYIPGRFAGHSRAVDVFSAAVFAQCLHYLATIWVLPRLMRQRLHMAKAQCPDARMRRLLFAAGAAGASFLLVALYAADYSLARKLYALAALVHAWLEIPVLVVALDRSTAAGTLFNPAQETERCESYSSV